LREKGVDKALNLYSIIWNSIQSKGTGLGKADKKGI